MAPASAARRPGLLAPSIATLMALAVLLGLGAWQWERRAWKEALIQTLSDRLAAAPKPLPPPAAWAGLNAKDDEFTRVTFSAQFLNEREGLVYSAGSSLRPDVAGVGYWVMTPARLAGSGLVIVNRGFVPEARRSPESRSEGQVAGPVAVVGVLRWPEARGLFTPADDAAGNRWFVRDPQAIADAKGLGALGMGPLAPFYIDQEAPTPPGGQPKPGPLRVKLPNSHLQYALTWFGLALALCAVFLIWAFRRPR